MSKPNLQIDELVFKAVFSSLPFFSNIIKDRQRAREEIRKLAKKNGIFPASLHHLYLAYGRGKLGGFIAPAFNLRFLTYDTARIIFRLVNQLKIGLFIFETARSEQKYTDQTPDEYAVVIMAAAIAENYQGPIFLQGDHYQFSRPHFQKDPKSEIDKIKTLIKKSVEAGFYNIDVDASTLVDLSRESLDDQQIDNYMMTALMTKYIREIEPPGVTVSIGGEIGHIGGKNSTVQEFEIFMRGYIKEVLNSKSEIPNKFQIQPPKSKIQGLSKISVQTGTSHGGTVLPNGKIAKANIDFEVLKTISKVARKKYGLGGVVQHGASTLPNELFDQFPKIGTLEIHLGTEFQNIVFNYLPEKLRGEIYSWIHKQYKNEWKVNISENQFIYKIRKKAAGPFKKRLWQMSEQEKKPILTNLEKQFRLLFEKLKVVNTKRIVEKFI